jgi:hypothetical protein
MEYTARRRRWQIGICIAFHTRSYQPRLTQMLKYHVIPVERHATFLKPNAPVSTESAVTPTMHTHRAPNRRVNTLYRFRIYSYDYVATREIKIIDPYHILMRIKALVQPKSKSAVYDAYCWNVDKEIYSDHTGIYMT